MALLPIDVLSLIVTVDVLLGALAAAVGWVVTGAFRRDSEGEGNPWARGAERVDVDRWG